ncbi:hypothetical protein SAMN04489834_2873 [Microterricola viridarii]|uniref:Uncharacterized protein n=1 Tax=Microterricola viridarii TaxID=412690 RepID=A0A1H1XTQ2_9MICO|nr:hypothetical protein SAMN04489834_2873 [Microterricola viridarii]
MPGPCRDHTSRGQSRRVRGLDTLVPRSSTSGRFTPAGGGRAATTEQRSARSPGANGKPFRVRVSIRSSLATRPTVSAALASVASSLEPTGDSRRLEGAAPRRRSSAAPEAPEPTGNPAACGVSIRSSLATRPTVLAALASVASSLKPTGDSRRLEGAAPRRRSSAAPEAPEPTGNPAACEVSIRSFLATRPAVSAALASVASCLEPTGDSRRLEGAAPRRRSSAAPEAPEPTGNRTACEVSIRSFLATRPTASAGLASVAGAPSSQREIHAGWRAPRRDEGAAQRPKPRSQRETAPRAGSRYARSSLLDQRRRQGWLRSLALPRANGRFTPAGGRRAATKEQRSARSPGASEKPSHVRGLDTLVPRYSTNGVGGVGFGRKPLEPTGNGATRRGRAPSAGQRGARR